MKSIRILRVLAVLVPLLAGSFVLGRITRGGMAVYADSVTYICGARSIRSASGYMMQTPDGSYERINLFPPLYSWLLAQASAPDRDVIATARWVHLILLVISIGLAMTYAGYASSGSPGVIFLAGMSWVVATDLMSFESIVLSESLFIPCTILSILLLYGYLRHPKTGLLVLAALATSAAWLSRYVGAAWVLSGVAALLIFSRHSWRRRFLDTFLFAALASGMNLYWMWRNARGGESVFGRSIHLTHFFGHQQAEALLTAFRLWTWRLTTQHQGFYLGLYAILLAGVLLSLLWTQTPEEQIGREVSRASKLLLVYAITYLLFLIFCAVFFQGDLFSDSTRILIPFHLLLLLFIILHIYGLLRQFNNSTLWSFSCGVALACLMGGTRAAQALIHDSNQPDSLMYAAPAYRHSPTVQAVLNISSNRLIYTNLDYPITLATNRECYTLPTIIDNDTQLPDSTYESEMKDMQENVLREHALVVYFKQGDGWLVYPSLDQIQARIPLRRVAEFPDGSIWESKAR